MSKKIIITGASSGIGLQLAQLYYQKNYDVGVLARRETLLKQLCANQNGDNKMLYACADVCNEDQLQTAIEQLIQRLGGLDIMIINAGGIAVAATGKDQFEVHKNIVQLNLVGAIHSIDIAAKYFRQQGHGHIVGISSISAYRGIPGSAAYSASKAALSNYLQAVRTEFINKDIAVSIIHPGFINTEFAENMSRYPFVISAQSAALKIYQAISKKRKNADIPMLPWFFLKYLLAVLPDRLIRKVFR